MKPENIKETFLKITCLPNYKGETFPQYASEGSSGFDLSAAIEQNIEIFSLKRVIIPTGIKLEIPSGLEGQIRPRSGLAAKNGITVLNTPGTIDSDYRGEIKVILINLSEEKFLVEPGMRIAQMIITPFIKVNFVKSEELSISERGNKGFGSSGV